MAEFTTVMNIYRSATAYLESAEARVAAGDINGALTDFSEAKVRIDDAPTRHRVVRRMEEISRGAAPR